MVTNWLLVEPTHLKKYYCSQIGSFPQPPKTNPRFLLQLLQSQYTRVNMIPYKKPTNQFLVTAHVLFDPNARHCLLWRAAFIRVIHWDACRPSNSDHQDYYISSRGSLQTSTCGPMTKGQICDGQIWASPFAVTSLRVLFTTLTLNPPVQTTLTWYVLPMCMTKKHKVNDSFFTCIQTTAQT